MFFKLETLLVLKRSPGNNFSLLVSRGMFTLIWKSLPKLMIFLRFKRSWKTFTCHSQQTTDNLICLLWTWKGGTRERPVHLQTRWTPTFKLLFTSRAICLVSLRGTFMENVEGVIEVVGPVYKSPVDDANSLSNLTKDPDVMDSGFLE